MCGIAGIWNLSGKQVDRSRLEKMAGSMVHRGPDAEGYFIRHQPAVGLAHRRLSIIDLSQRGNQPMSDSEGQVWIVFNGEIYNYVELRESLRGVYPFKTDSDTEVIIASYLHEGPEFIHRLRGMFGLAVLDLRQPKLYLYRDRLGKKPVYYSAGRTEFSFASEPKALLAGGCVSRDPDLEHLDQYFTLGFIAPPHTGFQQVKKLGPGEALSVGPDGAVATWPYWTPAFLPKEDRRIEEWEEMVRGSIRDAVRLRLRSDVPLGVFLSGGLDSSTIAAFAAESTGRVKTFSIGFNDPDWDERRYAKQVADRFATDHHEFVVTPDPNEVVPLVLKHVDDPVSDASIIPTLFVSRLARQHVTVALNGDGGDELFGGYRGYQAYAAAQVFKWLPGKRWAAALSSLLPEWRRGSVPTRIKRILELVGSSGRQTLDRYSFGGMQPEDLDGLLGPARSAYGVRSSWTVARHVASEAAPFHGVDRLSWLNLRSGMPGSLLPKADRASMAFSLEARSPLLDHVLVETVAKMPARLKLRGLTTKYILKRAMRGILPDNILHRSKMGFGVPLGRWFRGPLRAFTESHLTRSALAGDGILRQEVLNTLLSNHLEGKADLGPKIWSILFLEMWWRHYVRGEVALG